MLAAISKNDDILVFLKPDRSEINAPYHDVVGSA
jgi:hypothetical protein